MNVYKNVEKFISLLQLKMFNVKKLGTTQAIVNYFLSLAPSL